MTALPVSLEPPVVVWPRRQKSRDQHRRHRGRREAERARREAEIDAFHRSLHHEHRNRRHAERRIQRRARLHAAARQDDRLERDGGQNSVYERQREQSVIERAIGRRRRDAEARIRR